MPQASEQPTLEELEAYRERMKKTEVQKSKELVTLLSDGHYIGTGEVVGFENHSASAHDDDSIFDSLFMAPEPQTLATTKTPVKKSAIDPEEDDENACLDDAFSVAFLGESRRGK